MPFVNYALLALSIVFYGLYVWGSFGHFRRIERPCLGVTALAVTTAVTFAAQFVGLWPNRPLWALAWAAAPVYVAAGGLWAWAVATTRRARLTLAFSRDLPLALVDRGPYRFVRHPFYTSYTLYCLAGCVAVPVWWVAVPSAVVILIVVLAARREERKFATSDLARSYAAYRARTGMFLPSFRRQGRGG